MSIKFQQVQNHLVKSFVIEQIITSLGGGQDSQTNIALVVVIWNFKLLDCHF